MQHVCKLFCVILVYKTHLVMNDFNYCPAHLLCVQVCELS
jgi:hypothetical protein